MTDTEKLAERLLLWEELWEQGEEVSATHLCEDCPELVDQLQRQIDILKKMVWLKEDAEASRSVWPLVATAVGIPPGRTIGDRPDRVPRCEPVSERTLIHMATQQPERVEAMVLIGATIYFPEQAREIMRKTTVEGLTEQKWEAYRSRHKRGDDQIRALINQFHGFKDSYDDMNFTPPYLSTITARTFIVHGDRDEFFPVAIPVEMYRNIPTSYLWIIPNGGHVPVFGENEATFTEKALEFFKEEWEEKEAQ